jgi:hypothetical protein
MTKPYGGMHRLVPAGSKCKLKCYRGFDLVSSSYRKDDKPSDVKKDVTWECKPDGTITGPLSVQCIQKSCVPLARKYFPATHVHTEKDKVLKSIIDRIVERLARKKKDLTEVLAVTNERIINYKAIDIEKEDDDFYVHIPTLKQLEDPLEELEDEETAEENRVAGAREKPEKKKEREISKQLLHKIMEERKNGKPGKVEKDLLKKLCFEGKTLGYNYDAPIHKCGIVCEVGYVFRAGRSLVTKDYEGYSDKPKMPENVKCSRGMIESPQEPVSV